MANEKEMALAKNIFATICSAFDSNEWIYSKDEDELKIALGFDGNDIPMKFLICVDPDRQLVSVLSFLPFEFDKEKRMDAALATSYINYMLGDGSFDLSIAEGTTIFRQTTSYRGSLLSKELFLNMIAVACYTVDKYNDKLKALNDGEIEIKELLTELVGE